MWHYALFAGVFVLSFLGAYLLLGLSEKRTGSPSAAQQVTPGAPTVSSTVLISGLQNPWDIAFLPDSTMLITERSGAVSRIVDGQKSVVFTPSDVVARGEGGMLGLAVDPNFSENHLIYTCFNSDRSGLDVRVVRWEIKPDGSGLIKRDKDIVTEIPASPSGRHSGCQIAFGPDGNLWIGTGDAAEESNPQNLSSLGGKILRVTRDGQAVSDNNAPTGADKRIYSWGHRNTQGLAFYGQTIDGSYGISAEHGSSRDDEVNPLSRGNFGWAPGTGYDESVPMTDTNRFPDAIRSIWSSGDPTIAISGADFLRGTQWAAWENRLAVGVLKDKHLLLLELKSDGTIGEQQKLLDSQFGRLRAVVRGPDNALYISTDNSSDDKIIRLSPSS